MSFLLHRLTAVVLLWLLLSAAPSLKVNKAQSTQPSADGLTELCDAAPGAVTLDFGANITTGYEWYAYIVSGESASLQDLGYVSDPNPQMMDGVGGTHSFRLEALCEGETIVCFYHSQGQEHADDFHLYTLVRVDPDLTVHVFDNSDLMQMEE